MGHFEVRATSLFSITISITKGNEFTVEASITLSRCFYEDLTAVAHDIQQRGNSFT